MRATAKIFWILAVFFLIVAIAYAFVTGTYEPLGIETVGFPALLALAGLAMMIAVTASLAVKKNDLGASDDLDGEVSDDAGVQGSFSPQQPGTAVGILCASSFASGVAAHADLRLRRHVRHLRRAALGHGVLRGTARTLMTNSTSFKGMHIASGPRIVHRCGARCLLPGHCAPCGPAGRDQRIERGHGDVAGARTAAPRAPEPLCRASLMRPDQLITQ